jgi:hypothetical protein
VCDLRAIPLPKEMLKREAGFFGKKNRVIGSLYFKHRRQDAINSESNKQGVFVRIHKRFTVKRFGIMTQ